MSNKKCSKCQETKPVTDFFVNNSRRDGRQAICKACNYPIIRESFMKRKYGIGLEEYNLLLESQDGKCAICRVEPKKLSLSVDHDHDTGEVRGLLCPRCNRAVEWLVYYKNIASEYLEKQDVK